MFRSLEWPRDPVGSQASLVALLSGLKLAADPVLRAILVRHREGDSEQWLPAFVRIDIAQPDSLPLPPRGDFTSTRAIVARPSLDVLISALKDGFDGKPLVLPEMTVSDHPCQGAWTGWRYSSSQSLFTDWPSIDIASKDFQSHARPSLPMMGANGEYYADYIPYLETFGGYRRSPHRANAAASHINIVIWDRRARLRRPTYSFGTLRVDIDGSMDGISLRGRVLCGTAELQLPESAGEIHVPARPTLFDARLVEAENVEDWIDVLESALTPPAELADGSVEAFVRAALFEDGQLALGESLALVDVARTARIPDEIARACIEKLFEEGIVYGDRDSGPSHFQIERDRATFLLSELEARSSHTGSAMDEIKLFISHSSGDSDLAKALIDLIEAGLVVPEGSIRCTSVPGYKLDGGDSAPAVLRANLRQCSVVLGLLTHAGLASSYVLMELGAAWGFEKTAVPLLAPGVAFDKLPGPFKDIHALQLADDVDVVSLLGTISKKTGMKRRDNDAKVQSALGSLKLRVR